MNTELIERIEKALNSIRPYLEADGGNVKIVEVTSEMVLKLELTGTCSSCPMSTMTLKAGVEEAIKRDVPEIIKVEAVNVAVV
ncbi:NifU family protein [Cecembia calidifontis]|jgi:Fe-S cluster biogenesis protein NfuA|uniref:Fe-S cluster biogenesis protein NfuA n=1 Tax=Cecembia calidifontis TaxID=1187080 RepID=A0A4V2F6S2_9BACT|nr:NifU family protein [Cecembia calidifontis]RZS97309.1 Fe-S cluster biogenesis protein NfuA [Cecembia calidifontis]